MLLQKQDCLPLTNSQLINIFNKNLLTDEEIDKSKINQVIEQLLEYLELVQNEFVGLVKKCVQI